MKISKIFSSYQGEAGLLGRKQIFIRLAGCNLSCGYCDEDTSISHELTVKQILRAVMRLKPKDHHSISITGGEPLLQADALTELMPQLPLPVMLETNGTLPKELEKIKRYCHWFSVDWKEDDDDNFLEFIHRLKSKSYWVKVVLMAKSNLPRFTAVCRALKKINPETTLYLQPVTTEIKNQRIANSLLDQFYRSAINILPNALVVPQVHKLMGWK